MAPPADENKKSSVSMSHLVPDRRRENPKLPPPSQYRRPPKLANRRANTDPPSSYESQSGSQDEELQPLQNQHPSLTPSPLGSPDHNDDVGSKPSSRPSSHVLRRARTVHYGHQRRPSFPIIYRPTATPRPTWNPTQHHIRRDQDNTPSSTDFHCSVSPSRSGDSRRSRSENEAASDSPHTPARENGFEWTGGWNSPFHSRPEGSPGSRVHNVSESSDMFLFRPKSRSYTGSGSDCLDNVGGPARRSLHQRSNSVPSRQLLLASCPELPRRTHSQGHGEASRGSLPLHPLSQLSKRTDNDNSLAQLYRQLRGTLQSPLNTRPELHTLLPGMMYGRKGRGSCSKLASSFGDQSPLYPSPATNPANPMENVTPFNLSREKLKGHQGSSCENRSWHSDEIEDTGSVIHTPFSSERLEAHVALALESFINDLDDGDAILIPSPRRFPVTEVACPKLVHAATSSTDSAEPMPPTAVSSTIVPHNTPASEKISFISADGSSSGDLEELSGPPSPSLLEARETHTTSPVTLSGKRAVR